MPDLCRAEFVNEWKQPAWKWRIKKWNNYQNPASFQNKLVWQRGIPNKATIGVAITHKKKYAIFKYYISIVNLTTWCNRFVKTTCNHRSALPGYRGKGITSLIFSRPVAKRIILSKPSPNPACFTVPYRLRSRYHSYGSIGKPISFILQFKYNINMKNNKNQITSKGIT